MKIINIIILALLMLIIVMPSSQAMGQEPTETPIPTPEIQIQKQLSSGNTMIIERSVTAGDIAIMAALGLVAGLMLLHGILTLVTHYLY